MRFPLLGSVLIGPLVLVSSGEVLNPSSKSRARSLSFLQRHREVLNPLSALAESAAQNSPTPAGISPLDMWAIHDLLLIGHKGPLIQDDKGRDSVQSAANSLSNMLHDIHPVAACRDAVGNAADLASKAQASWSCLGLTKDNFTGAFTSEKSKFADAANTAPKFDHMLGACAGSQWPRACSYWASMHAMGVRADVQQKANEYFQDILRIISGGALYCIGCTSHWRLLNKYLLPKDLQDPEDLVAY